MVVNDNSKDWKTDEKEDVATAVIDRSHSWKETRIWRPVST